MDLSLKDKVFVITGGGAGIGEAITRGAAQEGAKLAIVARTPIDGTDLEKYLIQIGAQYLFVQAELSSDEDCRNAIQKIIAHFGSIYCLVNNAGINDGAGLEHGSTSQFEASLRKNLVHYFSMTHYALQAIKVSQGNVINIASKAAVTGQGGTSGYVASKGAQLALTREWAVELLQYQVRVNAVIPAEVYTPLYDKWIKTFENPEEKLKSITDKIPLGKRFTSSEEIANMVLFLASDRAAHITGQHLYVDGGYTHLDRVI